MSLRLSGWAKWVLAAGLFSFPALATTYGPPVVFFESGSARLVPQARAVIDTNLTVMLRGVRDGFLTGFHVTGHADRAGSDEDNMRLSLRRAQAVRDYLIAAGIPASMISVEGFGERRLLVETPDGVAEPQNRHAAILFRARPQ
jgi:OOP family OmpA-OmpF porin